MGILNVGQNMGEVAFMHSDEVTGLNMCLEEATAGARDQDSLAMESEAQVDEAHGLDEGTELHQRAEQIVQSGVLLREN